MEYCSRAPSRPLECYHGSCYSEGVEVVRENGAINGLRLSLITDGRSASHLRTYLAALMGINHLGALV